MNYTDLITVEELRKAFVGSGGQVAKDLADNSTDIYAAAEEVIEDVTSEIEAYLNRELIVREQTQIFCDRNWKTRLGYENADEDILFTAWARQWPVLQVVSVDTEAAWKGEITLQEAKTGGQFISYDPDSTLITEHPYQVVSFAGYRRSDQVLSGAGADEENLQDSLATLTVLPPLLPGKIRRVALRLAISELRQQAAGLVGVQSQSKQMGDMTVEQRTAGAVVYFPQTKTPYEKELSRLHSFRYVPA